MFEPHQVEDFPSTFQGTHYIHETQFLYSITELFTPSIRECA